MSKSRYNNKFSAIANDDSDQDEVTTMAKPAPAPAPIVMPIPTDITISDVPKTPKVWALIAKPDVIPINRSLETKRMFPVDKLDTEESGSDWVSVSKDRLKTTDHRNRSNYERKPYTNRHSITTDNFVSTEPRQTKNMDVLDDPTDDSSVSFKPRGPSYASMATRHVGASTSAGAGTGAGTSAGTSFGTRTSSYTVSASASGVSIDIKRKSFTTSIVKREGALELPAHYQQRSGANEFEIPQCEYPFIRRIGGLEKSESKDNMFRGLMACAISYYADKNLILKNKHFIGRLSVNEKDQEDLIEEICMQTVAIFFHRSIKSDSDAVKVICNNLPLYRAVPGNPADMTPIKNSEAASAYIRLRHRFMQDLRVSQSKGMFAQADVDAAAARVMITTKKWNDYILQSVWNGNNPIHDCLYYGADSALEYLLSTYYKLGMFSELSKMMLEPNNQNETHAVIMFNGMKVCESSSTFIIRRKQFAKCKTLYEKTIMSLKSHFDSLDTKAIDTKADSGLDLSSESTVSSIVTCGNLWCTSTVSGTCDCASVIAGRKVVSIDSVDSDKTVCGGAGIATIVSASDCVKFKTSTETTDSDGDDGNVCTLMTSGNIEGMINHIQRCGKADNLDIYNKTITLWKATVDSDATGQYGDYLEDTLYQVAEIVEHFETLNKSKVE